MTERAKYEGIYSSGKLPKYGHSNHGAQALPLLTKWQPDTLLDVGCGYNEFVTAARAAMPGLQATGVDFACPGADLVCDAAQMPFGNKAFDVITSFDMLEHVTPDQVDAVLAEFARVSRRFIFSISHVPSVNKWLGETLHPTVQSEAWWMRRIMRAGGMALKKEGRYITGTWQPTLRIATDARVILVGNGPSVLAFPLGASIDGFDVIVRFNTYHLAGFEKYTGTRTTLWSANCAASLPGDEAERPSSMLLIQGEGASPPYEAAFIHRLPKAFYNKIRQLAQGQAWWHSGLTGDEAPLLASSGLLVTAYLLGIVGVRKLTLTGFDHFAKAKSKQHHYWLPQSFGPPKEHDAAAEAALFAELQAAGRVAYLCAN